MYYRIIFLSPINLYGLRNPRQQPPLPPPLSCPGRLNFSLRTKSNSGLYECLPVISVCETTRVEEMSHLTR